MTRDQIQAFTLRISQANSTEMIVILYEMLLTYLEDAREVLSQGNRVSFTNSLRCARGCIGELIHSLNLNYEPAPSLLSLYGYCIRRLTVASIRQSAEPLEEIVKIITPLLEAYEKLAVQNTSGAVMNHSQTVYAGLTYGRATLTENMAEQGTNRGMLV